MFLQPVLHLCAPAEWNNSGPSTGIALQSHPYRLSHSPSPKQKREHQNNSYTNCFSSSQLGRTIIKTGELQSRNCQVDGIRGSTCSCPEKALNSKAFVGRREKSTSDSSEELFSPTWGRLGDEGSACKGKGMQKAWSHPPGRPGEGIPAGATLDRPSAHLTAGQGHGSALCPKPVLALMPSATGQSMASHWEGINERNKLQRENT